MASQDGVIVSPQQEAVTIDMVFSGPGSSTHKTARSLAGTVGEDRPAVSAVPSDSSAMVPPAKRRATVPYEVVVLTIYVLLTAIAVIDRFTWQAWRRNTFSINGKRVSNDRTEWVDGPWSAVVYDGFARFSGRYLIMATNLQFYTYMYSFQNWLAEKRWANRLMDFSNAQNGMHFLHRWNGWSIVIFTLIHVWSIFLPVIFNNWNVEVKLGVFEWPLSERPPPDGSFKDVHSARQTMMLQGDDVWRLFLMTLLLAILTPLSVRWMQTKYHIGKWLHGFMAVMYFIDIWRRHSHPHSWVLNTPFFVAWLVDVCFQGAWRFRRVEYSLHRISPDYLLLSWHQRAPPRPNSGENLAKQLNFGAEYNFRLSSTSAAERAHLFTGFENRVGFQLTASAHPVASSGGADARVQQEEAVEAAWSTCLLIRVFDAPRKPGVPCSGVKVSYTSLIARSDPTSETADVWGPFSSSMSAHVHHALTCPEQKRGGAVVLVAGGSGLPFVLDAVQVMRTSGRQLVVLYSTRDLALLKFVLCSLDQIVQAALRSASSEGTAADLGLHLAYTGPEDDAEEVQRLLELAAYPGLQALEQAGGGRGVRSQMGDFNMERALAPQRRGAAAEESAGLHHGAPLRRPSSAGSAVTMASNSSFCRLESSRLNLEAALGEGARGATVFVQGSAALTRAAAEACAVHRCKMVAGTSYD